MAVENDEMSNIEMDLKIPVWLKLVDMME